MSTSNCWIINSVISHDVLRRGQAKPGQSHFIWHSILQCIPIKSIKGHSHCFLYLLNCLPDQYLGGHNGVIAVSERETTTVAGNMFGFNILMWMFVQCRANIIFGAGGIGRRNRFISSLIICHAPYLLRAICIMFWQAPTGWVAWQCYYI